MSSQEEREDQQPEDDASAERDGETGSGDAGEAEAEQKPPSDDERIEQITERIDKARSRAEEAGVLVDDEEEEEEEEFVESGATEEEDDQTIAPPG